MDKRSRRTSESSAPRVILAVEDIKRFADTPDGIALEEFEAGLDTRKRIATAGVYVAGFLLDHVETGETIEGASVVRVVNQGDITPKLASTVLASLDLLVNQPGFPFQDSFGYDNTAVATLVPFLEVRAKQPELPSES